MENHRDDLVVIVAGYTEPTRRMIATNPGMASRLADTLQFDDYTGEQLAMIGRLMAAQGGYKMDKQARCRLDELCERMASSRSEGFGNGREVRRLIEAAAMRQAERVIDAARSTGSSVGPDALVALTAGDLHWQGAAKRKPVGFAA
jgi:hypothetical protein